MSCRIMMLTDHSLTLFVAQISFSGKLLHWSGDIMLAVSTTAQQIPLLNELLLHRITECSLRCCIIDKSQDYKLMDENLAIKNAE